MGTKASIAVAAIVCFAGGTVIGAKLDSAKSLVDSLPLPTDPAPLRNLREMRRLIQANHLGDPVTDAQLFHAAAKGMVQALKDPYTSFSDPPQTKRNGHARRGETGGIGIKLGQNEQGEPTVSEVTPDSPAEKAGLLQNDVIVAVQGTELAGKNAGEIINLIRGDVGSKVTLRLRRDGLAEPVEATLKRKVIELPSVDWKTLERGGKQLEYVRIDSFVENTGRLFDKARDEALRKNVAGIVLDLRFNGGGYLYQAGHVVCNWVKDGPYVLTVTKQGAPQSASCTGTAPLAGIPVVVLINRHSASSSEITAGALQDSGFTVLGEKSHGKGVGQNTHQLPDGSELKLVEFEWRTPKGRSIHKTGITPNVPVPATDEQVASEQDPQLDAAVQLLLAPTTP